MIMNSLSMIITNTKSMIITNIKSNDKYEYNILLSLSPNPDLGLHGDVRFMGAKSKIGNRPKYHKIILYSIHLDFNTFF